MAAAGPQAAGRVVVLDVVGLQADHLGSGHTPALTDLLSPAATTPLRPPFPAVTIPAQRTLSTGLDPGAHGDVANGTYDREADAVTFWGREQGDRRPLWETASEAGLTTGALFFQHLRGTGADVALTPAPIEDEDNTMLEMDCWSNPAGFYDALEAEYGHFPLHRYWGPGANAESSRWILRAAREAVERHDPDLLWVYVPHLDYDGQRHGPSSREFELALETVDGLVGEFLDALRGGDRWAETAVTVVSEYGFHDVERPVFPNRALREAGLLAVEADGTGGTDVALEASEAFAMVDHQVAHVYADSDCTPAARERLDALDGVATVLGDDGKRAAGIDHPAAGDLVLVAAPESWFQYYWWTDGTEAPGYATDTDIHAKPGYDPCELFLGESGLVSLDPSRVGGSHGRVDGDTLGVCGLGGPAAPDCRFGDAAPATAVAPTVRDLLGLAPTADRPAAGVPSLLAPSSPQ